MKKLLGYILSKKKKLLGYTTYVSRQGGKDEWRSKRCLLRFTSFSAHQNRWWDTLINFQTLPTQIQTKDDEVRAFAIFSLSKMPYTF
jgi:hypothetical protein